MQQRACVARAHGARGARCCFLQRSWACSGRPLSRCIATAFVARSLISESAQHELQHLAFIARVRNSLCVSLSLPAISLSLPVLCISLCISLVVSLCVSLSAPLSLRLSPPRTLSFCFSPDRRVCHHLSLRLSLSSFRPRLQLLLFISSTSISQGRRQDFGSGGTSDKISYMNSSQVLYCNGVAKISVLGGHSAKSTHQSILENFFKFINKFVQKFKKFFKHTIYRT